MKVNPTPKGTPAPSYYQEETYQTEDGTSTTKQTDHADERREVLQTSCERALENGCRN